MKIRIGAKPFPSAFSHPLSDIPALRIRGGHLGGSTVGCRDDGGRGGTTGAAGEAGTGGYNGGGCGAAGVVAGEGDGLKHYAVRDEGAGGEIDGAAEGWDRLG
jgi:hypothetical protein